MEEVDMARCSVTCLGVFISLTLLVLGSPARVHAQEIDWSRTFLFNAVTTTSTAGVVAMSSPLILTTSSDVAFTDPHHAQAYMNQNLVALSADIAVGAGQSIEDLAAMSSLGDDGARALGRAMRVHRRELLALLSDDHVSLEDVDTFSRMLSVALK